MSHQVIPAQDSTENEEGRLLWSDFHLVAIAEDVPPGQLVGAPFDSLIVRGGVLRGGLANEPDMAIEGSDRWSFSQRVIKPVINEFGSLDCSFCPPEGSVVIWREVDPESGIEYLQPPSLVVHSELISGPNEHVVTCLTDSSLSAVPTTGLSSPLGLEVLAGMYSNVSGLMRQSLLDLWPLQFKCPRCSDTNPWDEKNQWSMAKEIPNLCSACRGKFTLMNRSDWLQALTTEPSVWQWAFHLVSALMPLEDAGWTRKPVQARWSPEAGLMLEAEYSRGNNTLVPRFDPQSCQLTPLGTLDFGGFENVDSRAGASALQEMLNFRAPWIRSNSAQSGQTEVVNILHFDSPSHGGEPK